MLKRVVCSVLNLVVLMIHLQLVSSQLPADQVSAMTSIYEIIQNDTDGSFFVWNDVSKTSNPCSWEGVGCTYDNSFINSISFQSCSISTSEFLPFLCNISTLESLDVSHNALRSIPDGFFTVCGEISGLKVLDFSYNLLNGSLPSFNNGFRMLEKLDFSSNALSGEIPTNLGKMNLLEELYLSGNSFRGEIPWQFGEFTKLRTLYLYNNFLFGGIPASLSNITTLESFVADHNKLTGFITSDLLSGPNLLDVDLSFNHLEGPIPTINSTNLHRLYLEFNNFVGAIPAEISQHN